MPGAPKCRVMPVLHSCGQERAPGAVYVESDPGVSALNRHGSSALRGSLRRTDARASALRCDDCAARQLGGMRLDDTEADRCLLRRSEIDKPQDSGVRGVEYDRKFAKILVEGNDHLSVSCSMREDRVIAWIARPVANPLHLMARTFKGGRGSRPYATVEQKLQTASSIASGSTRSRPTMRRAYARQASTSSRSSQGYA